MLKTNHFLFYLILLSMIFIQCQCGDGPTEPTKDTTSPTIISTSPNNNALNVLISDSVIIVFSEKINSQTINNTSISVASSTTDVTLTDSIAIVTFSNPLTYSTTYTVTLLSTIADLAGNTLNTNTNFSFTTEADPATIPPTVLTTYPASGVTMNNITDSVTVYFSKDINLSTLNDTTFINTDGRTGTITYNAIQRIAIFRPTSPFAFDSTYTFNITTNLKDTYGNNLATLYVWSFNTPTIIPVAIFSTPFDSTIIGDTATYSLITSNPIGIDSVQYFVDNIRVGVDNTDLASERSNFLIDASIFTIGSEHTLYAVSFDSLGNFGYSDTLTFFYLWQLMATDGNDGNTPLEVPNDLRKMFARSTDSTLELRYEYAIPWDSAYWDTTVDLAIYFDVDFSSSTGRRTNGGDTINDIGAEYRALIGAYRAGILDTVVHRWDPNCTETVCWKGLYTFSALYNIDVPNFSKVLEFGIKWSDIGNTIGVDIVSINVLFPNYQIDPYTYIKDYMPDKDSGHVRIYRDSRYIGPPPLISPKPKQNQEIMSTSSRRTYINPF